MVLQLSFKMGDLYFGFVWFISTKKVSTLIEKFLLVLFKFKTCLEYY